MPNTIPAAAAGLPARPILDDWGGISGQLLALSIAYRAAEQRLAAYKAPEVSKMGTYALDMPAAAARSDGSD